MLGTGPHCGADGGDGGSVSPCCVPWCCRACQSASTAPPFPPQWSCLQESRAALWLCIMASKPFPGTIWKNRVVPDRLACSVCFPIFFFFSLCSCCKLEEDSSAAVLQACFRGRVCGAGAAWLPCSVCEGFLCVTPSVPCQHKPAAWTPGPGMLASFSRLGWVALVLLTLSLLRYMGIWMCLLILTLPKA